MIDDMAGECSTSREYHVLNLGAGVQSTTLYLMFLAGEILDESLNTVKIDAAVCADTQEEPEAVYKHIEWLKSLNGPPIRVRTVGKLGDDLMAGRNSAGACELRRAEGSTDSRRRRG